MATSGLLQQKNIINKKKLRYLQQRIIRYMFFSRALKIFYKKIFAVDIFTNYKNLLYFIIIKILNRQ